MHFDYFFISGQGSKKGISIRCLPPPSVHSSQLSHRRFSKASYTEDHLPSASTSTELIGSSRAAPPMQANKA